MKLIDVVEDFTDTHYAIRRVGDNKWTVAKFSGGKRPEVVYTVIEKKPGEFWTDSPGFNKVGQDVKTIKLVKQFIADGEPKPTYYKAEPEIAGYKIGSTRQVKDLKPEELKRNKPEEPQDEPTKKVTLSKYQKHRAR